MSEAGGLQQPSSCPHHHFLTHVTCCVSAGSSRSTWTSGTGRPAWCSSKSPFRLREHRHRQVEPLVKLLLVCRVLTESWGPGASRDLLELKEMKEPEDSLELQDPSDCRSDPHSQRIQAKFQSLVPTVLRGTRCSSRSCRVCQDLQGRRERREMLDLW